MRKLNWASLVLDLIYIALGILFIVHPQGVESILCYILAAAVAVIGLLYLVGYFILQTADESGRREGNGFAFGILLIIMAIFIVAKQSLVISLVPFLFGVMVLIRGLMVIQNMFVLRRLGFNILIPLVAGLLTMGFGIFVMLFPFETATLLFILIGVGLLVGGVSGIGQEFITWHLARQQAHARERARDMEGARDMEDAREAEVTPAIEAEAKAGPAEPEAEEVTEEAEEKL
ncbi:MAG: DUF308 domain-containing protein [Firmicutes bacterium]|nr:DUF308 domain-containing protein [Bacillota bacterium]